MAVVVDTDVVSLLEQWTAARDWGATTARPAHLPAPPETASSEKSASLHSVAPQTAPLPDAANKLNTQKENTQTQAGVRAGSRFTLEECRRYAEHLRATGQGINNPGGYATTILRTGEADEAIAAFLAPEQISLVVNANCMSRLSRDGILVSERDGEGGGEVKALELER